VVPELIAHGKVMRPQLGITPAPEYIMRRLQTEGVMIYEVVPDSAAEKAGLRGIRRDQQGRVQLGDIIIAVDGKPIKSMNDLLDTLEQHKVGDTVRVTFIRGDERDTIDVKLE